MIHPSLKPALTIRAIHPLKGQLVNLGLHWNLGWGLFRPMCDSRRPFQTNKVHPALLETRGSFHRPVQRTCWKTHTGQIPKGLSSSVAQGKILRFGNQQGTHVSDQQSGNTRSDRRHALQGTMEHRVVLSLDQRISAHQASYSTCPKAVKTQIQIAVSTCLIIAIQWGVFQLLLLSRPRRNVRIDTVR